MTSAGLVTSKVMCVATAGRHVRKMVASQVLRSRSPVRVVVFAALAGKVAVAITKLMAASDHWQHRDVQQSRPFGRRLRQ